MKTTTFTISELQKIIKRCKVHRERGMHRGKTRLLDEYVCTQELLQRLELFGEQKESLLSDLE